MELAAAARAEGKEVVVVMGVGFVGSVMAAIIADTVDRQTARPSKFVIGCDLPGPRSYWKIPLLNRGQAPVKAEDPEATRLRLIEEYRNNFASPFRAAEVGYIDHVILPEKTRPRLIKALMMLLSKKTSIPKSKHSSIPL